MLTPLKRLRLELDIKQMDLAAAAGIGTSTLSAIETGQHRPSLEVAFRIARELAERLPGRRPAELVAELFGRERNGGKGK